MIPGFYVWETASFNIVLSSPVLNEYKDVIVSICQPSSAELHLSYLNGDLSIIDDSTIGVGLTQEQTGEFSPGAARLQVNVLFDSSERDVTSQAVINIQDNLYNKVMS